MNRNFIEWTADRAVEQEGSIAAAIALYKRLIDKGTEEKSTDLAYVQSCRRTLAILEERLGKEVRA